MKIPLRICNLGRQCKGIVYVEKNRKACEKKKKETKCNLQIKEKLLTDKSTGYTHLRKKVKNSKE
jgi:hypothetical protein